MALDPTNPGVAVPGVNPDFLAAQQKMADAATKQAAEAAKIAASFAGEEVTEAGIYLRILVACIMGRVAASSGDVQIWATDLTRDYLTKYPLTPVVPSPPPSPQGE